MRTGLRQEARVRQDKLQEITTKAAVIYDTANQEIKKNSNSEHIAGPEGEWEGHLEIEQGGHGEFGRVWEHASYMSISGADPIILEIFSG